MKTKIALTLLLIAVAIKACAPSNTFKIVGKIEGIADGDVVQLRTVENRLLSLFMQDTIRDGKFSFDGEVDSLKRLSLGVHGNNWPREGLPIWISPGSRAKITGKGFYISTWSIKSNVKEQQEEEIYRDAMGELSSRFDSLYFLYHKSLDRMRQVDNDSTRAESRRYSDQFNNINFIQHQRTLEVMTTRPVTESWIDRLALYAGFAAASAGYFSYPEENMKLLQDLYNRLSDEQKQGEKGQLIHRYISPMEIIQEGQPMADAELYDPRGNTCKIDKDFRGKYLLLDFWGVGCAPCIAAFPEMKEIHEAHSDKLTIISISTDSEKVWKEGLERHQLPWVNLTDYLGTEGYASLYGAPGIPFYVLISPDGIVEKMWAGYKEGALQEKLKDILQ